VKRTCILGLPLVALIGLLACPPSARRVGMDLVEQGRSAEAVDYWLDSYEADQGQRRALEDALIYAPDAYSQLLDVSRDHVAEGRLDEARGAYRQLISFTERLREHGPITFALANHDAELREVDRALAQQRYDQALAELERGAWQSAVTGFEGAAELVPDYLDIDQRIAQAYRGWAEDDLEGDRYRDAIEHYDLAYQTAGELSDHMWSGAIHAAYGRDYLRKGACRRAVRELRAALHVESDHRLREDLATAQSCGRSDIIVLPVEDLTAQEGRLIASGAQFRDELEAALGDQASEFVRLLDPTSPQAKRVEDPTLVVELPGRTFQIRSRLTQLVAETPEPDVNRVVAKGRRVVRCDEGVQDTAGEERCTDEPAVAYDLTTLERTVRLAGSVRAVDAVTGEQVVTSPLEVTLTRQAQSTEEFTLVSTGETVKVAVEEDIHVIGVGAALLALMLDPAPLPTEAEVTTEALSALATQGAEALLAVVDVDREVREPGRLVVDEPIFGVDQLQFQRATPEVEPLPEVPEVEIGPPIPHTVEIHHVEEPPEEPPRTIHVVPLEQQ